MVCKEEIFVWFKHLNGSTRIEVMCGLIHMCLPLELRFFAACVEDLAKRDFYYLREIEHRANLASELIKLTDTSDDAIRSKLLVYLPVLYSGNHTCSNTFYKILTENFNTICSLLVDAKIVNEILLLYTMASYHPAFTFDQKRTLETHRKAIVKLYDEIILEDHSNERTYRSNIDCSPNSLVEKSTVVLNAVVPQVTIKNIEVREYPKKRSDGTYEYCMQVTWSNGESMEIYKTYMDLYNFHNKLLQLFPEEAGAHRQDRILPYLRGVRHLSQSHNEDFVKEVKPKIMEYIKTLLLVPQYILNCGHVIGFFQGQQEIHRSHSLPSRLNSNPGSVSTVSRSATIQNMVNTNTSSDQAKAKPQNTVLCPSVTSNISASNINQRVSHSFPPVSSQSPLTSPIPSPFSSPSQSGPSSRSASPWTNRNETVEQGCPEQLLKRDWLQKFSGHPPRPSLDEMKLTEKELLCGASIKLRRIPDTKPCCPILSAVTIPSVNGLIFQVENFPPSSHAYHTPPTTFVGHLAHGTTAALPAQNLLGQTLESTPSSSDSCSDSSSPPGSPVLDSSGSDDNEKDKEKDDSKQYSDGSKSNCQDACRATNIRTNNGHIGTVNCKHSSLHSVQSTFSSNETLSTNQRHHKHQLVHFRTNSGNHQVSLKNPSTLIIENSHLSRMPLHTIPISTSGVRNCTSTMTTNVATVTVSSVVCSTNVTNTDTVSFYKTMSSNGSITVPSAVMPSRPSSIVMNSSTHSRGLNMHCPDMNAGSNKAPMTGIMYTTPPPSSVPTSVLTSEPSTPVYPPVTYQTIAGSKNTPTTVTYSVSPFPTVLSQGQPLPRTHSPTISTPSQGQAPAGNCSSCGCNCNNSNSGNIYNLGYVPHPANGPLFGFHGIFPHSTAALSTNGFINPALSNLPFGNQIQAVTYPNGLSHDIIYNNHPASFTMMSASHAVPTQQGNPNFNCHKINYQANFLQNHSQLANNCNSNNGGNNLKNKTCYNCGGVGHRGNECKEHTMEEISKGGYLRLNYNPVNKCEGNE